MEKTISEKLKVFSFVATIFVVYRHSLNYLAFFGTSSAEGCNGFIQEGFMSLTQIAVPYFFLVSGFFFFKRNYYKGWNLQRFSSSAWCHMIMVKFRTLFIPFAIWNFVGLLTLVVTKQKYDISIWALLNSDWYGPLWYIRDLMLMMLLVPLYQWLFLLMDKLNGKVRKLFRFALFGLILLMLIYLWKPIDTTFLSTEGILFFYAGGLLQRYDVLSQKIPRGLTWGLLVFWISWSFSIIHIKNCHFIFIMVGIIIIWNLINQIPVRIKNKVLAYSQYSFLIYVLHFYLIKAMKVTMGKLFYGDEFISLLSYLTMPVICVCIIIIVGKCMQRFVPKFFSKSMGGRL